MKVQSVFSTQFRTEQPTATHFFLDQLPSAPHAILPVLLQYRDEKRRGVKTHKSFTQEYNIMSHTPSSVALAV